MNDEEVSILRCVGKWISFMSASSCPAEMLFSDENDPQTIRRNSLRSDRVRVMSFCRWNLRLFRCLPPNVRDAIKELVNTTEEEQDEED